MIISTQLRDIVPSEVLCGGDWVVKVCLRREMGKAEIMLKVLSSPDVDATSITAMLGDGDDPMVQQLLALRASGR